jgi:hypothetical protein
MLQDIYDENYQLKYDGLMSDYMELSLKAVDKKYVTESSLTVMMFGSLFLKNSKFNQQVLWLYDHHFKLGNSIDEMIKDFPEIRRNFKHEKETFTENYQPKRERKVYWKKWLGIIPYTIKKIEIKTQNENPYLMFSNLEEDMADYLTAKELGELKATLDFTDFLSNEYQKLGGTFHKDDFNSEMISRIRQALMNGDLITFFQNIKTLFASISYNIKIQESYFHCIMHVLLKLTDFIVESEIETNIGRIDLTIETPNIIYILELKSDSSAENALKQIKDKKYYEKYFLSNKQVILVGANFDSHEKNIQDWISEFIKR